MGWQSLIGVCKSIMPRGTNQGPWRQPLTFYKARAASATNLGAVKGTATPAAFVAASLVNGSPPFNGADNLIAGGVVLRLSNSDVLELMFHATTWNGTVAAAAAAGQTCNATIYLVHENGQVGADTVDGLGKYVGKLALTTGANAITNQNTQAAQGVDLVTLAEDYTASPGIRLTGKPSGGSFMTALLDHQGATHAIVVFEPTTNFGTTHWGVLAREY